MDYIQLSLALLSLIYVSCTVPVTTSYTPPPPLPPPPVFPIKNHVKSSKEACQSAQNPYRCNFYLTANSCCHPQPISSHKLASHNTGPAMTVGHLPKCYNLP